MGILFVVIIAAAEAIGGSQTAAPGQVTSVPGGPKLAQDGQLSQSGTGCVWFGSPIVLPGPSGLGNSR